MSLITGEVWTDRHTSKGNGSEVSTQRSQKQWGITQQSRARPFPFGNLPMSSSVRTNWQPTSVQNSQIFNLHSPFHMTQPLNHEDHASPGVSIGVGAPSYVFSSYRELKRQLIADGHPVEAVLGPRELDIYAILLRSRAIDASETPSVWAGSITSAFQDDVGFLDRLARAMIINDLMRVGGLNFTCSIRSVLIDVCVVANMSKQRELLQRNRVGQTRPLAGIRPSPYSH